MGEAAQLVFHNRDLLNHIFQYKNTLEKIEKCKNIYVKWKNNGTEKYIYTLPFGHHHISTKCVRWSYVCDEESVIDNNVLLISDWVQSRKKRKTGVPKKRLGIYFDWLMDDSHIKEKECDWYIYEFNRPYAAEFDLSMHYVMSKQYKSLQSMLIHASVERELLHRMYIMKY